MKTGDSENFEAKLDRALEVLHDAHSTKLQHQDAINSLLSEEFHTTNGILTDPYTHNLFYVTRTKAVLMWLSGILGAGLAGFMVAKTNYGHGSSYDWAIAVFGGCLVFVPGFFLDKK